MIAQGSTKPAQVEAIHGVGEHYGMRDAGVDEMHCERRPFQFESRPRCEVARPGEFNLGVSGFDIGDGVHDAGIGAEGVARSGKA